MHPGPSCMPDASPTAVAAALRAHYDLVIFDADDTLRRTVVAGRPCPYGSDEWELLPGVEELLRALCAGPSPVRLGIATNQDHVGYGLLDERVARRLLDELVERATGRRVDPEALQLCPHTPEDRCACRKPEPGMLRRIMTHYGVRPARTLFVGNTQDDREAAARAGVAFAWAWDVFGWEWAERR